MRIKAKPRRQHRSNAGRSQSWSLYVKQLGRALGCVLVFFAVGYLGFWCYDPANFPISSVKVFGETKYLSKEVIQKVVLPELKGGFFRLKVSTLQQQLLLLPWVKQVSVRKVWPDQLVLHFEEHSPLALWGSKGVFSTTGVLFYPDLSKLKFDHLPKLRGSEGKAAQVWQQYLAMEQTLLPLHLTITQLDLAPRGAWHLKLSNGITVILGTNDVQMRLKRFVLAYEKSLQERQQEIAYVDLRYTSGMAVGWKAS